MKKRYSAFDALLNDDAKKAMKPIAAEVRAMLEVAEIFNNIMLQNRWNKKRLAEELEVSPGYVSRILAGDENLSVGNMAKLLYKLGRSYHQYSGRASGSYSVIEPTAPMKQKDEVQVKVGVARTRWLQAVNHETPYEKADLKRRSQ